MQSEFKYSYDWANKQVFSFYESNTRATEFASFLAGITTTRLLKALTYYLMKDNQIQWRALKKLIKSLNGHTREDFSSLTLDERRDYLKHVKWICQDEAIDEIIVEKALDSKRRGF